KFFELLQELPPGAQVGIGDDLQPTQDITLETVSLHAADMKTSTHTWTLGASIPTADAIQLGPDLADLIHRWIGALIPLYRFAAWTRENDFIEVNKKIQEEKTQRRHQAQSLNQGDKVRVTAGLFSGKIGVIESVDTKGKTKVRVGKMSVVVPNEELLPAH
ncbi:MAG: KOW motif-containing protein, partial [Myxococcota bacterium]|nr:KOW motif-containing protein [Myxococcota bacterium]